MLVRVIVADNSSLRIYGSCCSWMSVQRSRFTSILVLCSFFFFFFFLERRFPALIPRRRPRKSVPCRITSAQNQLKGRFYRLARNRGWWTNCEVWFSLLWTLEGASVLVYSSFNCTEKRDGTIRQKISKIVILVVCWLIANCFRMRLRLQSLFSTFVFRYFCNISSLLRLM